MIKRYWFPNALTTANLFCGFVAILFVIHAVDAGNTSQNWYVWAALTICLAALCDALDGRLARSLNVSSLFGKELDSLADIVSFGVAPAVLVYEHVGQDERMRWLWIVLTGLFVCCGAARLARYNIAGSTGRFFTGMPIPAAGLTITGIAVFPSRLSVYLLAVVLLVCALLMISTLRYPSWDQLAVDAPIPIRVLFLSIFVVSVIWPRDWFFLLPVSYLFYGLVLNALGALRPGEA